MTIELTVYFLGEDVQLNTTVVVEEVSIVVYDGYFSSGGGGGAVDSVNGKTGTVVLNADDIAETSTRKWLTATLNGYYDSAYAWVNTNGANVLQSISALTTAIGGKVDKVTGYGLSKNDFTDALKNAYDGAVTNATNAVNWISSNGTNLLNHLVNTSNPHNTTASQVGAYTTSQVDTALDLKANKSEVATVLFKSITQTIVTGKTAETCIYAIPLPRDGFNYMINVYSQAQVTTFLGAAITQRFRVGSFASPIDGVTGTNSIGLQTLLAINGVASPNQNPLKRNFTLYGGASGSIYGLVTSSNISDDANTLVSFTSLASKDFTVQNYLYVTFNPSNTGAVIVHGSILVTAIKI